MIFFFDIITKTCFTHSFESLPGYALFSPVSFSSHQSVFSITDRTSGSSQFCVQITEEMHRLHSFVSLICYFLSVLSKLLIMYYSVLKKKCKYTRKGVVYWVLYPNLKLLFLTLKFAGSYKRKEECNRAWIAQWLEHWTCDQKLQCLSPSRRIFFSRVNFLCWHLPFWFRFIIHIQQVEHLHLFSYSFLSV